MNKYNVSINTWQQTRPTIPHSTPQMPLRGTSRTRTGRIEATKPLHTQHSAATHHRKDKKKTKIENPYPNKRIDLNLFIIRH